jgi:hypothetical protein
MSGARAHDPPDPASAPSAGPVRARRRRHSQNPQVRPVGRRRQRRELGAVRPPARRPCGRAGRLRPTPDRAPVGRTRQPCARGARPTADDRQHRRRRIQRRAAPAPAPRRRSATRSSAAPAPPRTRTAAAPGGTHSSSKSLHWPSHSGSAFTFVWPMDLPRTARACGPRPPRTNGQTWGRTGRSHRKVTAHALNTHPHARDRPTGAFGAAIVP